MEPVFQVDTAENINIASISIYKIFREFLKLAI